MIKQAYIPFVFFLVVSTVLTIIFFHGLKVDQFLYIGDQFIRINYYETFINSFFIRKPENLSILNAWQFVTPFWDMLYYFIIYSLHIPLIWGEKLLFLICLFLSLSCSYVGFKKIKKLFGFNISSLSIFVITFWYCFNPYTVELWHG